LKPAQFDFFRPGTLDEVFELLNRFGDDARLIAGGQSLVPMMNLRMARPAVLIDLVAVGLSGIRLEETTVRIGAMTRQSDLLTDATVRRHLPLVASAANHIGHFQTRSRGTVGGSLAHADPSAELSLVMVTLGASLRLQSMRGERLVPASEFFVDALTTVISEGEVLTEIIVPVSPGDCKICFREFARRHGDFAIASAAVQLSLSDKSVVAGLGALGRVPHLCRELCAALSAETFDLDGMKRLVAHELAGIEPISDLSGTGEYRRHVAAVLLLECLQEVFDK
jgi:CO/xanthine dehydrogenase FAD-binding subunit